MQDCPAYPLPPPPIPSILSSREPTATHRGAFTHEEEQQLNHVLNRELGFTIDDGVDAHGAILLDMWCIMGPAHACAFGRRGRGARALTVLHHPPPLLE